VALSQLVHLSSHTLQAFDCCIIESTGISLPMPVAATFALIDQEQNDSSSSSSDGSSDASSDASSSSSSVPSLQQVARLDTMVTVVDGERFVQDVLGSELLHERGLQAEEGDERTVAELLIAHVREAAACNCPLCHK
jgi:G3E family GTPase